MNATLFGAVRAFHALLLPAFVLLLAPATDYAQERAVPSPAPQPSIADVSSERAFVKDTSFDPAYVEDQAFSDSRLPPVTQQGRPDSVCAGEGFARNCLTYCGFFVGLGGSYNNVKLDQDNRTSATSEVFSGPTLVAAGTVQERYAAFPASNTLSSLAPVVQVGYFRSFVRADGTDSDWLWGSKFAYKYLDLTFTQAGIDSLAGSTFANTPNAPPNTTFAGHNFIGSTQTWVSHELALVFFAGHAINRGQVYLGGGPVGFSTETRIYQPSSFVEVNGVRSDIDGQQNSLHGRTWMMGGIGQVGAMFDLGRSCFVDFSYELVLTRPYTKDYSAPFRTTSSGYTDVGTVEVSTFMAITAHAFNLTLVKRF